MLAGITRGVKEVGLTVGEHGFCVRSFRAAAATSTSAHGADIAKGQGRLGPLGAEAHYQLALVSLQLSDVGDAEGHLREAISLRADFGPAYLNLGVALVKKGERQAARTAFLAALRLDLGLTRAYYNLGILELEDGRLDEAEVLCQMPV